MFLTNDRDMMVAINGEGLMMIRVDHVELVVEDSWVKHG